VPGIGSITGEPRSSHASASRAGDEPCSLAACSSTPPGQLTPLAIGNHGMNDAVRNLRPYDVDEVNA
jgi:hypothetical protein